MTVGGDVSASFGSADPGFFNYTDYEHSALRLLRIDLTAAVKVSPHFALLGEVRTENLGRVRPYAFYLRIRPWTARDFDIQVGRVPPTFGAFARRTYANDNPLIGYPLAYQYLTTLRPDALPASADELLQQAEPRLAGALFDRRSGADHGVPLVSAFRWDTGVQAHGTVGMLSATAAVTAGTVSNPLFSDDNHGRQLAGRVELRPVAGLIAGTSLARGPFVSQAAARAAVGDGHDAEFTQTAWGGDAGVLARPLPAALRDHRQPLADPDRGAAAGAARAADAARRRVDVGRRPLQAAARPVRRGALRSSGLQRSDGASATLPWDAPVTRIEIGAGYSIQRNLLLKGSYQHNHRDGGVLLQVAHMVAAQLVFWF